MSHLPAIVAFGLVNLPMLGWMAAAAAPILIHMWSRRSRREMPWAAMDFLLAAVRQQAGRLWIEQWFLLAVRMLLIVLVVAAIAEPYLERTGLVLASGGRTHRAIVIDGSYSMSYKPGDKSRFERAKELAQRIVEQSPQGDAFTLILMASPPRVIVGTPSLESREVLREIEGLSYSQTAADLTATLGEITSVVRNASSDSPRLANTEVYFLTDLQRLTWEPERRQPAQTDFLRISEQLAEIASLTIIDLGQPQADNVAATRLRTLETVPLAGRTATIEAILHSFSPTVRRRQSVELLIDGRRREEKQVDLATDSDTSIGFAVRFDAPGDHAVEVRAPGDALEVDNRRHLIVPVRTAIRALCIDGRPSSEPFGGAADYLALALSPQKNRGDASPIHCDVAIENALLERSLTNYDCIFLCNVAQFTAGESRVLDGFLRGGGNLVFFLGDQVRPESYHRELGVASAETQAKDASSPRPLFPARLGEVVDRPQYRLDPLEYRHPIMQVFRGRGEASILTTPVFKHFTLEMPPNTKAKTVLATGDGDPLIVEQAVGRGRVVLVGTSADVSWSGLPLWPSFVPLVQEIAFWCVGQQSRQRNILVGEPIVATLGAAADTATLQGPDGQNRPVQTRGDEDAGDVVCDETWQSGIYTLRSGLSPDTSRLFAVNIDTAESDLAQIDADTLQTEVWPGIPFVHQTSWQEANQAAGAGPILGRRSLPVDLLYAVLGLLFCETVLAWRFGRPT